MMLQMQSKRQKDFNMQNLFKINGFTAAERTAAYTGCPGKVFFLTAEFIAKYYRLGQLPEEHLATVTQFAAKLQSDPETRALLWHFYDAYCVKNLPVADFPEILEPFGLDSGMIYLLVQLAILPTFEERAIREGFPLKYAQAAMERVNTTTVFFAQKFNGAFGYLPSSLGFLRNFKNIACFRIGRFDFDMAQYNDLLPEIYSDGKSIIALCQDGWMFDARGERTVDETAAVQKTALIRSGSTVTGIPVNKLTGYAEKESITLDLAVWEKKVGAGDWTMHFHIPGGGGMTPEVCAASFAEAKEFYAAYFPDKPIKLIWSNSWFFNPAYKEYLPESNIAKLSLSGFLFPVSSTGKDGLKFVFGREDDNFADYEQKTSLQRAVLRCQKERGSLRRTGWFILP